MMISVIICTYNRSNIIKHCLESILHAENIEGLDLLVVDNNSSDDTYLVVSQYPRFRYIKEEKVGLSHARNRGIAEAKGEWLFYLDDDAKVRHDIFNEVRHTIDHYDFGMFTGIFKAWYVEKPPKWLPFDIGNYPRLSFNKSRHIGKYYVTGNVMVIHKETLQNIALFPIGVGMNGDKVGYGEETFIETRFREKSIPVGINPNMVIYHQVLPYKYKLSWILRSTFQRGYNARLPFKGSFYHGGLISKNLIKALLYAIMAVFNQRIYVRKCLMALKVIMNSLGILYRRKMS